MNFNSLRALTLTIAAASVPAVFAQSSYQAFVDSMRNEYTAYRDQAMEHYSDFLRGEWHEFEPLTPRSRYTKPKPKETPVADNAKPKTPDAKPKHEPVTKPEPADAPADASEGFLFYTLPVKVAKIPVATMKNIETTGDLAEQMDSFVKQKIADRALPALEKVAEDAGLNDYLKYRLVNDWAKYVAPDAELMARQALIQYMLLCWGYDARIGYAGNGAPLLFLPLNQTVYDMYTLDMKGKNYTIFLPDGVSKKAMAEMTVHTYDVDPSFKSNRTFDMIIGKLNFPMKPHQFDLAAGDLHLSGTVNANLMPVLYRYPMMEIESYVRSNPEPEVRDALVGQVKEQLAGKENDEDVEALLNFMQYAFDYATDEDNHGFEKPYFVEENLYYDRNDCEDRAIMYSYLLWHALGKENQIVNFPMHEATTVKLSTAKKGTSYTTDDGTYYISDPTYVGAPTGEPMRSYRGVTPKVDFSYKKR